MILMAGLDLPLSVVREQIAASVDVIVQQARMANGRRVVTSIVEVAGMESGRIQIQQLFRFDRAAGFSGCGALPGFMQDWADEGVSLEPAWFSRPPPYPRRWMPMAYGGIMIWLAAGAAMCCAAMLAWHAQAWFAPALRRYRALYTQDAGVRLSEVFLFIDPAQLWAAAMAFAAMSAALVFSLTGSGILAALFAGVASGLPA